MKEPERFEGTIHDRVVIGETHVAIVGPDPGDPEDTVHVAAHAPGLSFGLLLSREEARRLGELLIASANDGLDIAPAVPA